MWHEDVGLRLTQVEMGRFHQVFILQTCFHTSHSVTQVFPLTGCSVSTRSGREPAPELRYMKNTPCFYITRLFIGCCFFGSTDVKDSGDIYRTLLCGFAR